MSIAIRYDCDGGCGKKGLTEDEIFFQGYLGKMGWRETCGDADADIHLCKECTAKWNRSLKTVCEQEASKRGEI